MRTECRVVLLLCALAHSPCQGQRKPPAKAPAVPIPSTRKPTSIEGDVYLVTKTGDVKRAAANTVRLLAASPELLISLDSACGQITRYTKKASDDSSLAAVSKVIAIRAAGIGGTTAADLRRQAESTMQDNLRAFESDHAMADTARKRAEDTVAAHVVATAPTGINAHYKFADLKPGSYLLIASAEIGSYHYQWFAILVVAEGQEIAKDLDNSALNEGSTYCLKR